MGLMDTFTSDAPVEMKQPEYYRLIKEAVKAELMMNGITCGTPHTYIMEIMTGKPQEHPQAILAEIKPVINLPGKVEGEITREQFKETVRSGLSLDNSPKWLTEQARGMHAIIDEALEARLAEIIRANDEKLKNQSTENGTEAEEGEE